MEGRDDTAAVKRAADCETIETHGFGISRGTWDRLQTAYEKRGLIIFTDPDHAGEEIRRRLSERFPDALQAFLSRNLAEKDDDIGIENAHPEDIADALSMARCASDERGEVFSETDMIENGLSAGGGAKERRRELGQILGIGYGNAKVFLRRLNKYGITREEFNEAVHKEGN